MTMADLKSFFEPQAPPIASIFIQCYAGDFLSPQEVSKVSRKRDHSFSHRTHAHSLCQCRSQGEKTIEKNNTEKNTLTKVQDAKKDGAQVGCHKKGQKAKQQEVTRIEGLQQQVPGRKDQGCTLMLRNLPSRITQQDVLKCLAWHGFKHETVLLYVPWVMGKNCNVGYGFVHLQSKASADALMNAWHSKHPFGNDFSDSALNIALASVQGAQENIDLWSRGKMARVRNPNMRPMILKELPSATMALQK